MFEAIGWFGTCLYLVNHFYISVIPTWKKPVYYTGNLVAALALVISSLSVSSMQAVSINGFWALISLLLLAHVPIDKIPFSRRAFYVILVVFIGAIIYSSIKNNNADFVLMGWFSTYIFCFGYLLFSSDKLIHTNYLLLNFVAAVVLIPQLSVDQNYPVLILEVAWAIISLYGVAKKMKHSHLID